jgi:putative RNA 2'-phosphotransferase
VTRATRFSRFLTFVLRHRPEALGLQLDRHGWADIERLLTRCGQQGLRVTRTELLRLVAADEKQRFTVNPARTCIRANYGHSVPVDCDHQQAEPPEHLFHGTVERVVAAIRREGLRRMQRNHVHLSEDRQTAATVGRRRGEPVILRVQAGTMHQQGYRFYRSERGVWLIEYVPGCFISVES